MTHQISQLSMFCTSNILDLRMDAIHLPKTSLNKSMEKNMGNAPNLPQTCMFPRRFEFLWLPNLPVHRGHHWAWDSVGTFSVDVHMETTTTILLMEKLPAMYKTLKIMG